MSSIFFSSDHKSMKLEIKYRDKSGKITNVESKHATKKAMGQWLNHTRDQKIPCEKLKWKQNFSKSITCSRNSSKKEVHGNIGLPQEKIKTSNKQPKLLSKEVRKRTKQAWSQ